MKNYIQPGELIPVIAPANVKSGDLIVVGAFAGVCAYDADLGEEVEIALTGVFEFPKASGEINAAAPVWWDATTNHNVVNASSAGLFPIGVAVEHAATGDATVRVRLSGIPVAAVAGG